MFSQAWNTPWKLRNELGRWLVYPGVRLLFARHGIAWGAGWRFYGIPIIQKHRHSLMSFGAGLQLRSTIRSNPLGPNHPVILATWKDGARLEIGARFAMSGGALCAAGCIRIGNDVTVGANTTIIDTDFHPLYPEQRMSGAADANASSVVVGDDVFIGMNCLILKGSRIGKGSVVGAGSVVRGKIPSGVIVAGNPAEIALHL